MTEMLTLLRHYLARPRTLLPEVRDLRAAASTERGPTAQDARDSLRGAPWLRPRTAFRRLNPEPFVPSAGVPLMKVSKADFPPPDTAVAAAGSNAINPCQKDTAHDN